MPKFLENDVLGKTKRDFRNKPLSSYLFSDWKDKYNDMYESFFYSSQFKEKTIARTETIMFKTFLLSKMMNNKFEFSTEEILDCFEYIFEYFRNNNRKLSLYSFKDNSIIPLLEEFSSKTILERESSLYRKNTYIPHFQFLSNNEDLESVINKNPKKHIQNISNFGFILFHKYISYSNKISDKESSDLLKNIIIKKLIKKNIDEEEQIKKIFLKMISNTILWEPYCIGKSNKNFTIFNWEEEFDKLIDFFEIKKEIIWEEKNINKYSSQIPCVKKMLRFEKIKDKQECIDGKSIW